MSASSILTNNTDKVDNDPVNLKHEIIVTSCDCLITISHPVSCPTGLLLKFDYMSIGRKRSSEHVTSLIGVNAAILATESLQTRAIKVLFLVPYCFPCS